MRVREDTRTQRRRKSRSIYLRSVKNDETKNCTNSVLLSKFFFFFLHPLILSLRSLLTLKSHDDDDASLLLHASHNKKNKKKTAQASSDAFLHELHQQLPRDSVETLISRRSVIAFCVKIWGPNVFTLLLSSVPEILVSFDSLDILFTARVVCQVFCVAWKHVFLCPQAEETAQNCTKHETIFPVNTLKKLLFASLHQKEASQSRGRHSCCERRHCKGHFALSTRFLFSD